MSKTGTLLTSTTPTGSMNTHQPHGGNLTASKGAEYRTANSFILPQPSCSRISNGNQMTMWLSTSSRPASSASTVISPQAKRTLSPPQPPPLPPPPPSPQLVPLKARLARSKSTSSQPVSLRPEYTQRLRKASDGGNTGRISASSSVYVRSSLQSKQDAKSEEKPVQEEAVKPETVDATKSTFVTNPSAFLPIAHPTERSALVVCLASLAFLSFSFVVTSIFSTLILPFILIACLVRRMGLWFANAFQYTFCCQCGRMLVHINSSSLMSSLLSRLSITPTYAERCQCYNDFHINIHRSECLRALSAAELRWLPALDCGYESGWNGKYYPSLYTSVTAPLVIVCLRFGAPGLKLSRLRDLIGTRLLNRYSNSSSLASSPKDSQFNDRSFADSLRRRRASSLIPPADTRSRLTQCLTYLSTGYAWRECMAFRLEDHVIRVPTVGAKKLDSTSDSQSTTIKCDDGNDAHVQLSDIETLINEVSTSPLRLDRPLWKAHLVEYYYEADTTDPSDLESDQESDVTGGSETCSSRPFTNQTKRNPVRTKQTLNNNSNRNSNPNMMKNFSNTLICRRSGSSSGLGSLLIFQFHPILSDDGKALVHLLTSCLTDLPTNHINTSQTTSVNYKSIRPNLDNKDILNNQSVENNNITNLNQFRSNEEIVQSNTTYSSNQRKNKIHKSANIELIGSGGDMKQTTYVCETINSNDNKMKQLTNLNYDKINKSDSALKPILLLSSSSSSTHSTGNQIKSNPILSNSNENSNSHFLDNNNNNNNNTNNNGNITTPTGINNDDDEDDDDDLEETEAAQWWYKFWASSLATIATVCDLLRVIITGPAIIFHKYFFINADMGLITKYSNKKFTSIINTNNKNRNTSYRLHSNSDVKIIHKCALLSLVKLSRLREITKASYSELIMSLLAGSLRAYHQVMGLKHPPDLLAFLATETPVLPSCRFHGSSKDETSNGFSDPVCPSISRVLTATQRICTISSNSGNQARRHHTFAGSTVEAGLLGNPSRMIALGPPPSAVSSLCPGRYVLADFCLPLNTEGMLPRLWETKQRLTELNASVDPLCLAWARTALYTLLPHSLAKWIEFTYGGTAKASVTITGVEVVSPFSASSSSKSGDSSNSYQMPKARRLAYMSLLASKSAEARLLRQRLRKHLPRGAAVYIPRSGTSFRALSRHLVNANAGIIYIAGSPVIRIDTWMPPAKQSMEYNLTGFNNPTFVDAPNNETWHICRDLSVTFTTYAGQLSVTFSASSNSDIHPNLDLILQSMRSQLNKMCQLLSGRHIPSMATRWLHHTSASDSSIAANSAVNMSPSLNPSLVLHNEVSAQNSNLNDKSNQTISQSNICTVSPNSSNYFNKHNRSILNEDSKLIENILSESSSTGLTESNSPSIYSPNKSFYNFQAGQPIEQLQDRFRWVQQQLDESSSLNATCNKESHETSIKLSNLRKEFGVLLKLLKQRCSQGDLGSQINRLNSYVPYKTTSTNECKVQNSNFKSRSRSTSPQKLFQSNPSHSNNNKTDYGSKIPRLEQFPIYRSKTITTGDFDEDPDFCITGYPDKELEDIDNSESDFVMTEPSIEIGFVQKPNQTVPERNQTSATPGISPLRGSSSFSQTSFPQTNELPELDYIHKTYDYCPKLRRGRKSITASGLCHPSLLVTEVASLHLIPSRRGSLVTPSNTAGTENILTKIMKTVSKTSGTGDKRSKTTQNI